MSEEILLPTSNRRRFTRYFALAERKRAVQGKLVLALLVAVPLVALFATHMLVNTIHNLVALDPSFADRVQPIVMDLTTIAFLFIAIIVLLCAITIYFVFFVGVRVFGPQIALVNFIKRMQTGDYREFRKLRDGDELGEIWTELQILAKGLNQKKSPDA